MAVETQFTYAVTENDCFTAVFSFYLSCCGGQRSVVVSITQLFVPSHKTSRSVTAPRCPKWPTMRTATGYICFGAFLICFFVLFWPQNCHFFGTYAFPNLSPGKQILKLTCSCSVLYNIDTIYSQPRKEISAARSS